MPLYTVFGTQDLTSTDRQGHRVQWYGYWLSCILFRHKGKKIGSGAIWRRGDVGWFRAVVDWAGTERELMRQGWSVKGTGGVLAEGGGVKHMVLRSLAEVSLTPYPCNPTARLVSVSLMRQ